MNSIPRLRIIALCVLLPLAGAGCYTAYVVDPEAREISREDRSGANPDRPVRVVVLVPAQPIALTGGDPDDQRVDWFPVELVVGDPRFAIFFRDLDSIRRDPEEGGENRAALLDTLPNRLTGTWGPGKHPHIHYRRYLNLAEYRADAAAADPRGSGRLVIRLYGMESRTNGLVLLSCLTALVVPFYSDEAVYAETFFLSLDGQVQNLSEDRAPETWPKQRKWFGWLFFLWGPIVAADDEEILAGTIDAHICAAARTGIFVPASSRMNL
ncbi:MAG: hypothetical protein RIF32_14145 [Leptospirales bacterium]